MEPIMGRGLRRLVTGALAGAAGTLAMDLVWYRRYRRGGGDDGFGNWEFATSTASFDEASAPGQVGKRLADVVGVNLPDDRAGLATNVMHWLTGVGYGLGHAVLQDRRAPLLGGALTGAGAFANSYATMGAMGVYEPIWTYDRESLLQDLSAHLAFGLATGLTYRILSGTPSPKR
jgi:hypothetical protein